MNVLINALSSKSGGAKSYLNNLLAHDPPPSIGNVYVLCTDILTLTKLGKRIHPLRMNKIFGHPLLRLAWERVHLYSVIRDTSSDVLFCPGGTIGVGPLPNCKTVAVSQNLMPFVDELIAKYPLGYQRARQVLLKRLFVKDFVRADLVIFLSEHARALVASHLMSPMKRCVVVPHGIADDYRPRVLPLRPAGFPKEPYFLYVSPFDVYKSQIEVVQGYAKLRQMSPGLPHRLVLAGGTNQTSYERAVRAEIARHGLQNSVVLVGHVLPELLPAAYAHASVNIFASEVENCPITLLEAMASGRPLVCSSRPPMPEFAGNAAQYFDPGSPHDLATALNGIIASAADEMQLGRLGRERSSVYTWDATARSTWEAVTLLREN